MPMKRPIREMTKAPQVPSRSRIPEPIHEERPVIKTPPPPVAPPPTPVPTPKVPPTPTPVPTPIPRGAAGGKVVSASKRADGCAQRGKTKGKMY